MFIYFFFGIILFAIICIYYIFSFIDLWDDHINSKKEFLLDLCIPGRHWYKIIKYKINNLDK